MVLKFLKKVLLFGGALIIILLIFFCVYRNQLGKVHLKESAHILICGDSHTQCALNDSILLNSINVSQSSEAYIYTYNVIKVVRHNNPQINTIILGYSFHSLADSYDQVILDEAHTGTSYPCFVPILDCKSFYILLSRNFSGLAESFPNMCQAMLSLVLNGNSPTYSYPFLGKYRFSIKSTLSDSSTNTTIQRHYFLKNSEQGFSSLQEEYLKQIIAYCKTEGIKLILINTPINSGYYNKIPAKFVKHYYSVAEESKQDATFLDFHSLTLPEKCYGDGDHLNYYGAEIFTPKVDSAVYRSSN